MPIPLGILAVAGAGAGGGGSFDLLETTVLSSAASSVTFSSLGSYSDYKHLRVRYVTRSSRVDTDSSIRLRLNSDTGSNYAWHRVSGNGSTVASPSSVSDSYALLGFMAANSATANAFAAGSLDLLDFSNSSKNTTIRNLVGNNAGINHIALYSGLWVNAAAVTSIEIYDGHSTFTAGSRFSLYGVK